MRRPLLSFLCAALLCPLAEPAQPQKQLPAEVNQTFTDIAAALPEGQKNTVTVTVSTGEKYTLEVTGTGKGIGIHGAGKDTKVNAAELTPPSVNLPGDSGGTGGGGKKLFGSAIGFEAPTSDTLWLRWLCGITGFLIAVGGGYYEFRQANFKGLASCIVAGSCLIAGAIWPALLILGAVAAVIVVLFPYIQTALRQAKTEGLLAKVGSGIDSTGLDFAAQTATKDAIAKKMDPVDKLAMEKVLKKHKIGKYATLV